MIVLSTALLKAIIDAAEAAYPHECCGLLVGREVAASTLFVTGVEPSPNVSGEGGHDRFEIDPGLRFTLMRRLAGGPNRLIGHYHSHPDHPAQPSVHDLDMAFEPDLVWLIISVIAGQAVHITAHVLDAEGRQFRAIELRTADWKPYGIRAQENPQG